MKRYSSMFYIFIFIVSLFSFCLIGCDSCAKINSYEWKDQGSIYDKYEINDFGYSFNAYSTQTENAFYIADKKISQRKRNKIVTDLEIILEKIDLKEPLKYYIYDDLKESFVSEIDSGERIIHISQSTNRQDMIIATLQGAISPYANYGLLYGTAAQIHQDLGWGKIKIKSDKKIREFVSENTDFDLYDLNYPCFKKEYGGNEEYAKALSVDFVRYLNQNYGINKLMELIILSSEFNFEYEHRFAIYINEYIKNMGGKYAVFPPSQTIRYSPYITEFPLRIHTISCNYYVFKNYKDPYFDEDRYYFELNYPTIKYIFSKFEEAYSIIRSDFEYTQNDKVFVIIDQNDSYLDYYDVGGTMDFETGDNIRLRQIFAAVHEYVHSISIRKYGFNRNWVTEAICDYYWCDIDFIVESNDKTVFYGLYNSMIDTNPEIQERKEFYLDYVSKNNLDFNEIDFIDAMAYINPKATPLASSLRSDAYTLSFLIYLINNYGIKNVIPLYYMPSSFEHLLGKSSDELISEWKDYLKIKFALE